MSLRFHISLRRRRAAIAVWAAISLVSLMGFAALSVDLGFLYMIRAELQACADAAAMAAVSQLASVAGDRQSLARQAASIYASKNKVGNQAMQIDPATDVIFGQAIRDPSTGRYTFVENAAVIDAVRVRVRKTADSPNGAVQLMFANIFGRSQKDMFAQATAILIPRDISVVVDLSASHNDDSELRKYLTTPINLYDVWVKLPQPKGNNGVGNGIDPPPPGNPLSVNDGPGTGPGDPGNQGGNPTPGADPTKGPTWGYMTDFGTYKLTGGGKKVVDNTYSILTDPGLTRLPRGENWSNAALQAKLLAAGYNQNEVTAILSADYDTGDLNTWKSRVMVALGLGIWRSGMPADASGKPALWEAAALAPGDGNGKLDWETEMNTTVLYSYPLGSWSEYLDYVRSTYTRMYTEGSSDFRYRFGIKTFVNYLLEYRRCYDETPDLYETPEQPMQAVKDGVAHMVQVLDTTEADDQVSLEGYDYEGRHLVDLTQDFDSITTTITTLQAGHFDLYTNIGDGEQLAIDELSGSRSRGSTSKVMILLTDGNANVDQDGVIYDELEPNNPAKQYAIAKAQQAAAMGIKIYTVTVGAAADIALMQQIAAIGNGVHYHADGTADDYTVQLQTIFDTVGSERRVMLID